jgi:hypothetical protein
MLHYVYPLKEVFTTETTKKKQYLHFFSLIIIVFVQLKKNLKY